MKVTRQLATHFRSFYYGQNSTGVCLKDVLEGVDMQMATTRVADLNTIALLLYHLDYYVRALRSVLSGGPLDAHDKYSFDMPPIETEADWQALVQQAFDNADAVTGLIEQLPEDKLWEPFVKEKYGNYFRNIMGVNEHSHYHLGQMQLVKKMLARKDA